jgi:hypothetical protein
MSQLDAETKEIDGHTYKVMMLDPLVATDLLADIGQILAPTLGAIGGVLAKEKGDTLNKMFDGFEADDDTNIDAAIEKAVVGFFQRFDKAKQRELIQTLAKVTVVVMPDGKEPRLQDTFQIHFRGRLKALYQWLAFALKVQFQDFFSGTDIGISRVVQKVAQATSSSPTT